MSQAEIKTTRGKKNLHLEEHHGYCDFGPLEEKASINALAMDDSLGSAVAHSFLDSDASCSDSADSSDGEPEKVLGDNLSLRYFVGSDEW